MSNKINQVGKTKAQGDAHRAMQWLASMPGGNTTLDRKALKELLLMTDGRLIARGEFCDIRSKNIGAGVYQVYLVKS